MNNLILTKTSTAVELKDYFRAVLELSNSNSEFPINLDEVWALCYGRKNDAVEMLTKDFIQDVDYQVLRQNPQNPSGGRPTNEYHLSVPCFEFFIARKVRPVFEVYRQVFHRAAKMAQMQIPQTYSEALLLAANQAKQIEQQQAQIEALTPKADYYDEVLHAENTFTATQVAETFGQTAKWLNAQLCALGVQYKHRGTYYLSAKYKNKGYTKLQTIVYYNSKGEPVQKLQREWTAEGRKFIGNLLMDKYII